MLGDVLVREQVCGDPGPFLAAAAECLESKPKGEDSWGYSISDLTIHLGKPRRVHPKDVEELDLNLSVFLGGKCSESVAGDPFYSLAINFVLSGFRLNEDISAPEVLVAWHFDRHITGDADDTEAEDSDGQEGSTDVHPLYHFHYGGQRMYHLADQLGATMLLDPPRIMHPPMDAILAVDFSLSNFAPAHWHRLRENSSYVKLLRESFRNCWSPFFDTLRHGFGRPPGDVPWSRIELLYPALCPPEQMH